MSSKLTAPEALSTVATATVSRARFWAGWILSGLLAAFFLLDGAMKLVKPPVVVQTTVQLGYPESAIVGTGVALLLATLLYLVPPTAILGAILLTGYLGGAVAIQVRVLAVPFNIVFPVVFGVLVWASLYLRDPRLGLLLGVGKANTE